MGLSHLGGDLNKMSLNFPIIERIYRIKNLGTHKETIRADHPILIFSTTIPIPLKNEIKTIIIIDQTITTQLLINSQAPRIKLNPKSSRQKKANKHL